MRNRRLQRGFSLLETLIALILVGIAMTGLVMAFGASGQFGVLTRRQANALALARSIAGQISHVAYNDARLTNNNTGNDAAYTDPNGLFALPSVPTSGTDVPDTFLGNYSVGDEVNVYAAYVNVAPLMDTVNVTVEQGREFAVIVRYTVGSRAMRAVALGFRYNPTAVGVGTLPL